MKRNKTKALFIAYCVILLWIILLKTATSLEDIRFLAGSRAVNFVPFDYDVPIGIPQMREALLNMLLFVPMGIYLRVFDIPGKKTILWGFLASACLELCQFALAIGVCDITDLLTNTLGTAVGVGLYGLIRKLYPAKHKADKLINTAATIALLLFFLLMLVLIVAN